MTTNTRPRCSASLYVSRSDARSSSHERKRLAVADACIPSLWQHSVCSLSCAARVGSEPLTQVYTTSMASGVGGWTAVAARWYRLGGGDQ